MLEVGTVHGTIGAQQTPIGNEPVFVAEVIGLIDAM